MMKIIFDNEEQKKQFTYLIFNDYCPSNLGLRDKEIDQTHCDYECEECWANCGIELELKEKENE